jgi:hypothetical protein
MGARASCLFILLAGLATAGAADPLGEELAMKTDALINLPRYVEWPEGAFVVPKTPIMIAVYGHSKVHKALVEAAQGKTINGRTIMVRRYYWPQVPNSHVLFIAQSERSRIPWIMKRLAHTSVLTVSEFDDFLTRGGIVRMSMKDEKIRFHVNTATATDIGLKFSSQFLTVADQVVGQP